MPPDVSRLPQSNFVDKIHEDLFEPEFIERILLIFFLDVENLVLCIRADHDVSLLSKNGSALTEGHVCALREP